jgi:hypothetical protein
MGAACTAAGHETRDEARFSSFKSSRWRDRTPVSGHRPQAVGGGEQGTKALGSVGGEEAEVSSAGARRSPSSRGP